MSNSFLKMVTGIMVVALSLALLGCGASHRLGEYTFRDHTAAAVISAPPRPWVFAKADFGDIDPDDLAISAFRAVTQMTKSVTAGLAQARLDSAMEKVDVPERIKDGALQRCSEYLHFQPIQNYDRSDFLFDMDIDSYGIDADSWDAGVYFKIDLRVYLIDNKSGLEIWKTRVKEKQPVSPTIFGDTGSAAADNVITAIALSQLSVEEMVTGFQYLADDTADRVAHKLRQDFAKSRESK